MLAWLNITTWSLQVKTKLKLSGIADIYFSAVRIEPASAYPD